MVHKADLVIIGISVGVAIGILVAIGAFFCIRLYRKPRKLPFNTNTRSISSLSRSISTVKSPSNTQTDDEPQLLAQKNPWSLWNRHAKDPFTSVSGILRYSYKELERATDNFTTILGQGSFGPVFRATMPTNEVVAVKVLASDSKQGEREFHTEVFLLARLHHRNLVNLVGYCVDKGQKMLMYEYMSNGSLANHLYCENTSVFSWDERLQVALDISYGIEYLHEGASPPVIHRDLKSANILLDQSMRAKVADFGLSKEEVFDSRNSCVKGTYGYMDPEYVSTKRFTKKSDIYSFGIILFELITAINPQQGLMDYIELAALSVDGASGWDEILDKKLVGKCNLEEVGQVASIAYKCVNKIPRKRPSIIDVSQAISRIRQHRLRKEDTMSFSREMSRVIGRIEHQHIELGRLISMRERTQEPSQIQL